MIRTKCNLRKALTLQNFAMHFAVPHTAAALTAAGVHNDVARQFSGAGIKV